MTEGIKEQGKKKQESRKEEEQVFFFAPEAITSSKADNLAITQLLHSIVMRARKTAMKDKVEQESFLCIQIHFFFTVICTWMC